MNWPSGVQWEWAIGDALVLGILIWELRRTRRSQRQDRERAAQAENTTPPDQGLGRQ